MTSVLACLRRSLVFLAIAVTLPAADSWPRILSSIGLQQGREELASIRVAGPGAPADKTWFARVDSGMTLILEGESPAAEMFGFRGGSQLVRVGSIVDQHRPTLPIIWEKPLDLPLFTVPAQARVFAKERWAGAPIIAGYRLGSGAVLWVITDPGKQGYERFPYLLQALNSLGLEPPFKSNRLWAFFDYSYRTRADLDYFAERWRASGIGALHVAAWHFWEADAERDAYLKKLIEACHRNGVLVYAWLELPHVSEKFWNDHPDWREKTAILEDAHLDWRKLMNLQNRECGAAVGEGVQSLIGRFDWDGVNLAELYFESLEGIGNPARFTPMNPDVRRSFQESGGFDPLLLFSTRKDPDSSRAFLNFRADLARRMQEQWIQKIELLRVTKPHLDVVLTHVDDQLDGGMRDAIGADAARVLPLLDKRNFTFLIEDPATVWHLGPERYLEIAQRYRKLTPRYDSLAIDINIVDRYQDVYPTKQQTGTELFQLVHLAASAFSRVALYFENSILPPDIKLLSAAAAQVTRSEKYGSDWQVDSARGVGVVWSGPAKVNGKPWPVSDGAVVWLPAGPHSVMPGESLPEKRVTYFNGDLESAQSLPEGRLELGYQSASRAIAVLNWKPTALELDGIEVRCEPISSGSGWVLLLPRGRHWMIVR